MQTAKLLKACKAAADMEKQHFLKDFVGENETRQASRPWYNPEGDCIIYEKCSEAVIAERIDEVLTIYNSAISGKAIGCQIKGVVALTTNGRELNVAASLPARNGRKH